MPPKRKSDTGSGGAPKKSKTDGDDTVALAARYRIARPSAICPRYRPASEAEEEEEQEDGGAGKASDPQKNAIWTRNSGKPCVCMKPSAENPEHIWVMTSASLKKFVALQNQTFFRDPDNFGIYVYNDFYAYGITELVQNVLLDFDEAKYNWKEQWALLGTTFLAILATLERNDLLKPDSEIKSLRATMASWIQLANDSTWEDGFDNADARVYAYATKHGIDLSGSGM
ncbi:hypothetical protein NUU61_002650 [Penicillium alfredii]|uniref:Uncharacterized protein n=1 Tax=Penicillium alfredii TaxID=1506179 RepID=A0A9W9FS31_9EURO|nr:uncharacterized protein NUU61_002650 [Penicillium alfredii]KAJ5105303.1 hypothetical protein NUU61_002650 [Penicillium alfredii]